MDSIIAVLFGAVQGLTEFIPVSSSGHLVILHGIFPNLELSDELAFDVSLHVGTLASLLIYFRSDIALYLRGWFTSLSTVFVEIKQRKFGTSYSDDQRLAWYIVFAIIPAGLVGFFFEDLIDRWFRSPVTVVVMLMVVAVVFLIVERRGSAAFTRSLKELSIRDALYIGCMQVMALVPGTSRSGITIIAGMMSGLTRAAAARFSFLISIPLVAAAGLKKGLDLAMVGVAASEWPIIVTGVVTSALVGYAAIAFLLKFLERRSLRVFAWYRIVLAVTVFILFRQI